MRALSLFYSIGIFICFATASMAFAQVSATPSSSTSVQSSPLTPQVAVTLQDLVKKKQALGAQLLALVNQGATTDQIQNWQQQNASAFATINQVTLGLASQAQPISFVTEIAVPADASPAFADFLAGRADSLNKAIQQFNQNPATASTASSFGSIENKGEAQTVVQQVQALSAQSSGGVVPIPTAPVISTNASPQLRAYLIMRYQLINAELQIYNQNSGASSSTQYAAIQQWRQANALQFTQLQKLAQNLPPNSN
jgi:hypothetical protein